MSSIFFYDPFYDLQRLFDDVFGDFHKSGQVSLNNGTFRPRMDLHEDKGTNTITATIELPGLKREDVNIELQGDRLVISAESKASKDVAEGSLSVKERRFGKFVRALRLPRGIKDKDIKASMADGVLTVTFPKSTPELAPKKISIAKL